MHGILSLVCHGGMSILKSGLIMWNVWYAGSVGLLGIKNNNKSQNVSEIKNLT